MIKIAGYLLLGLFLCTTVLGQNPASKGGQNLSDQQLLLIYQQAESSGLTETDITNLLQKKGLSSSEITSV